MKTLLKNIVVSEVKRHQVKEKMTGFLVKKKKRGTYQALEECGEIEKQISENIIEYINAWLLGEIAHGKLNKELKDQIKSHLRLELYEKGFLKIEL